RCSRGAVGPPRGRPRPRCTRGDRLGAGRAGTLSAAARCDHGVVSAFVPTPVAPPSPDVRAGAAERLAALATPAGALGRLGDLAVWVAATQGQVPPEPVDRVRAVIFAGDHGVTRDTAVSAYPREITGAMVHTFLLGRAGVSVLAAQHGVTVRVLDLG